MKTWYVYLLCYPDTEEPFYVGKGTGNRMHAHEHNNRDNKNKCDIIQKLREQGKSVLKKKIAEFSKELDAYIYEWAMINLYHNQITNIRDIPGKPYTKEKTLIPETVIRIREKEEYAIEELFKRLPVSISELARKSKISEVTAAGIRDGKTARLHTINKLLATFSELYGIDELTVDNVTGLHILVGRYGEKQEEEGTTKKEDDAA